ncbi:Putative uncharacterized transposon-derived protein F54H12.3 [Araneus ventricosus]|uniref:Uncharacterized transposon-derived protein F54H12.3 n=1 Tax=Araneus ventricosus TaxID=182803 RepID=A0A4Y2JN49_ARAVE|nr:Putative uncharacterized transposon-derived protein F54H12.3 [Araneus ventricosus]
MIEDLEDIPNPTIHERFERSIVKPIIKAKKTFGMGSKIYCLKCTTRTDSKDAQQVTSENGRPIMKRICVDCGFKKNRFSPLKGKYGWTLPIHRKTEEEVTKAFKKIFKERIPEKLQTDKVTEFINKDVQLLSKENNFHRFTTENVEIKCSIVERFNRTLNGKIRKYPAANNTNRYIAVLSKLVNNYNNSYHRSIKMTPVEANQEENSDKVYQNLFKEKIIRKSKFKVGDKVRILVYKSTFRRCYQATFTEEIFVISETLQTDPITYRVRDLNNEEVKGTFYENELVKYDKKDNVYKIEKLSKS